MRDDIIYEHLTEDQINILDYYEQEKRADILNCIEDLHNAGVNIYTAIDIAFKSFGEDIPND